MTLNKEEERFVQRWSKHEKRGKYFYIIAFGLIWGTAVAVGSKIISSYGEQDFWTSFQSSGFLLKLLIYNIIGMGIYTYHWYLFKVQKV